MYVVKHSSIIPKRGRTNEACQRYAEALMDLCREMDVKAINMFEAVQKKDGCFT